MPYLIAEIGINHQGSLELALKMMHSAKRADADAVKFQLFKTEALISKTYAPEEFEFFKSKELSFEEIQKLYEEAQRLGIDFLCTAFDELAVDFLDALPVSKFKVASGDLTNEALLMRVGSKKKPVLVSTGMANLAEISWAIEKLRQAGASEITLLHCVSLYPTPLELANLLAIETLKQSFGLPVGYSDHTVGIASALCAVALGAEVVEKHFVSERSLPGPDIACSADEKEFALLRKMADEIALARGNAEKIPSPEELEVAKLARRSLFSAREIKAGEVLSASKLIALRPQIGIPAGHFSQLLGAKAKCDISQGSPLNWQDLELS